MIKEMIICIAIIIAIITGNYSTQNYTKNVVKVMDKKIEELEQEILNQKGENIDIIKENLQRIVEEIQEEWKSKVKILSLYIEHDEIEKVEINIDVLKNLIDENEATEIVKQLDESMYILKHIEKKYAFSLENIF